MTSKRNPNAYSIWLIPTDKKFLLLKKTIFELSQFFENIKFIPHVTLISNLNYSEKVLSNKVEKIAKKIMPFNIHFKEIEYLDEFFQSFFISMKMNSQLGNARKIAESNFPQIKEKYNPHLSLAYGEIESKIKKNLKNKTKCPVNSFMVKELYLAHNDEINFKWEVINKFPLECSIETKIKHSKK
jgi:2'-5' RNA ligase